MNLYRFSFPSFHCFYFVFFRCVLFSVFLFLFYKKKKKKKKKKKETVIIYITAYSYMQIITE